MKFGYRIVLDGRAVADISTDREFRQGEVLQITSGALRGAYKVESVLHGLINTEQSAYPIFRTSLTMLRVSKIS